MNEQNEYTAHLSPEFYASLTKAQAVTLAMSLTQQLERVSLARVEAAMAVELGLLAEAGIVEGVGDDNNS